VADLVNHRSRCIPALDSCEPSVRQASRKAAIAVYLHCNYTAAVPDLRLEWDERKNAANKRKHAISFEEAQTVFYDDQALLIKEDESGSEERFLLLGLSSAFRTLVVSHCYRESDEVIRIISARRATRYERAQYNQRWSR
jgi:uncharacterized DUF497 family protein